MSPVSNAHALILARYDARVREFEAIAHRRGTAVPAEAFETAVAEGRERGPSSRELEVLGHAADGFTNHEIGERMQLAEETVKSHLQNVKAKLGARNRTHAVAISLRTGLLEHA